MFKHILIPTDGSELSERVANRGVMLAKTLGATVIGLHVIPSNFGAYLGLYGDTPWLDVELQEQMREAATAGGNKYLDRMETAAKAAGIAFTRRLVETNQVWRGIVETAEEQKCDLIMMAAHGRRGVTALLASETHKVLTHSKIAVLVYR